MVIADIILIAIAIPLTVWCLWSDLIKPFKGDNND
jgi:hypothetical protein|tara:strand:- start:281 stop:385 length:105 start_codon:yes stop_codon:yes gene_type:complete